MAYCRFSSDDFQCDVYCYEDVSGGWTTHVASKRVVFSEPLPAEVPFDEDHLQQWLERHQKIMNLLETATREPITLPHAGDTFNDPTAGAAADTLIALRMLGYNVPQYAIDTLLEEGKTDA